MNIPYTAETRPDTGVTNAQLGIWLFLASELMLFGSLFSAYALLRAGAETWPDQSTLLSVPLGAVNTVTLLLSSFTLARAASQANDAAPVFRRTWLAATLLLGIAFLGVKGVEWAAKLADGLGPATNNFLGLYFAMTGLHAAHLLGGILVVAHLMGPGRRMRASEHRRFAQRVRIAALYWHFVDAVWISLFVVLYLV